MQARHRAATTAAVAPAADRPDLSNKKVRAILAAARKLFLEQELTAPTMDLIADTAGVSKATIYVYFLSREKLLLALIRCECESDGTGVIWEAGVDPTDIEQDLRSIARRLMAFFLSLWYRDRALLRLVEDQSRNIPEVGRTFLAAGPAKTHQQVVWFLTIANAKGLLIVPDVNLVATQFMSLVRGDLPLLHKLFMPLPSKRKLDT